MKKVIFLVLASLLVLSACGGNEKKSEKKTVEHKKSTDKKNTHKKNRQNKTNNSNKSKHKVK